MLVACNGNNKVGYGHFFRCLSFVKFFSDEIDQPIYFCGEFDAFCRKKLFNENIEILYHDLDVLNLNRKHSLLIDSYDEDFIKRFYNLSKNIKVFALNDNFFNSPYSNVDLHIDFIINIRAGAEIYENFICEHKLLGVKNFWGSKELWKLRKIFNKRDSKSKNLILSICLRIDSDDFPCHSKSDAISSSSLIFVGP